MTLTTKHKRWIVAELAMYGSPSEVAMAFRAEFGAELTRQQAEAYDAGKARHRERMGGDLVELFDKVREQWNSEEVTVAIFNKRWRGEELQRMYDGLDKNAVRRRAALLEQGAKESGDAYTNRRELTGKDGAPLPGVTVLAGLDRIDDAELDRRIAEAQGRKASPAVSS